MDLYFRNLIQSYDLAADKRDEFEASDWKKRLRQDLLSILQAEGKTKIIDIGAGTGIHGKFFLDQGLNITCIDISPAHIEKCREKGLNSILLSVLELNTLDLKFDCVFAMNSLLHIPTQFLPDAITNIATILEPGGLFYWGQYGGEHREGIYQDDHHEPKRFFNLLDDELKFQLAERTLRSKIMKKFFSQILIHFIFSQCYYA